MSKPEPQRLSALFQRLHVLSGLIHIFCKWFFKRHSGLSQSVTSRQSFPGTPLLRWGGESGHFCQLLCFSARLTGLGLKGPAPSAPFSSVFIFNLTRCLAPPLSGTKEKRNPALNPTLPRYPSSLVQASQGSSTASSLKPSWGAVLGNVWHPWSKHLSFPRHEQTPDGWTCRPHWSLEKTVMEAKESDTASRLLPDLLGCGRLTLEM